MTAFIIGITSGILLILLLLKLKNADKELLYGLTLTGIGFIYIGFTWSDFYSLLISSLQALVFLFLAFFGLKRNIYILAIGYFLHGIWDIIYSRFDTPGLIPPQYDVFCLTIDFTIGLYLLYFAKQTGTGYKTGRIQH